VAQALITLLTDFGTADYFVGAMKGAILSACPSVRIIDISHEVPAHDIQSAAFTLLAAHASFPTGTIHLAVVDPGVGSARRGIIGKCAEQIFVGPDNGIFTYVFECEATAQVFQIQNEEFFRRPVSPTFHGRDIFGPVAAAFANGVEAAKLGSEISDWVRLEPLAPVRREKGRIEGRIIHIDRFGNCITNFTNADVTAEMKANGALLINGRRINSLRKFFAEKETADNEGLFAIYGSAGFLEIAARNLSAAEILKAKVGQLVLFTEKD
jgi:S-adenosyl-L-methionine hydrolase (adenosine-forming)